MPTTTIRRPLWAHLAAWLGFLAVFCALLAPVSMLAEDVRTGQLGGLCSVSGGNQPGNDDASLANGHCALCGSTGLGLPALYQADAGPAAVSAMVVVFENGVRSAALSGLPFSRGPPTI